LDDPKFAGSQLFVYTNGVRRYNVLVVGHLARRTGSVLGGQRGACRGTTAIQRHLTSAAGRLFPLNHSARRLQQTLDLAEVAVGKMLLVELTQPPDFRARESDETQILVRCILKLGRVRYFQFVSAGSKKYNELVRLKTGGKCFRFLGHSLDGIVVLLQFGLSEEFV